jgi:uncharacterized protein (TIGR02597 family)
MNRTFIARLFAAFFSCTAFGFTAEVSDPIGVFRLRLRGNSDTIVSLPVQRTPLVEAGAVGRSGNSVLLDADIPALPPEGAFALVMSGTLEGAVFPITGVSGRTLTVDAGAFDLAGLKITAPADLVAVVPYWTLDTLFPAGAGVNPSTDATARATEVLFYDPTQAGINLSAASTFFYFAGNSVKAAGWYKVGATATTLGTQRLAPHAYMIIRHNVAGDKTLSVNGGVQMAGFRIPVGVRAANTAQDNFVALPIATPISLADSRLVESGAFAASPNAVNRTDELLVFDNTIVGQNKSAVATYFYFAGSAAKAAGWYKVGDTAQSANGFLLKPGEGYIIRKAAAAAPRSDQWHAVPSYLK